MSEKKELEEIRNRKIKAMLEAAQKTKQPLSNQPIMLDDTNFSNVISTNELVVVDFWAPWCGPCRTVGPVIEQLAAEYTGKVTFGKMNVDQNQVVPSSFSVMSIPTIVVFYKGKAVERIVGAYPKTHIEAVFKRYLTRP